MVYGLYDFTTGALEIEAVVYKTAVDCLCCECEHVTTEVGVSGRAEYSVSEREIRWVFEDLRLDLLGPGPPPGVGVIRSITLNGDYVVPALGR